jgi:beta-lactamase regulating signal transducer with metallopeptidase domain
MMWQVLIYATAFAAAISVGGPGLERFAARHGVPRRVVWAAIMATSLLFPLVAVWGNAPAVVAAPPNLPPGSILVGQDQHIHAVRSDFTPVRSSIAAATAVVERHAGMVKPPTDRNLAWSWATITLLMLLYLAMGRIRIQRQASGWRQAEVHGTTVLVSKVAGPALLGVLKPRVVVPEWFLTEPAMDQRLILAHERQHLDARDPLLLYGSLIVAVLVPWNLPLWWQQRRLRLAVEMDCDERVVRAGADPEVYGHVLLSVTRRALGNPLGVVAMSEPASTLERRVRNVLPVVDRFVVPRAIGYVALIAAGIAAALALQAPALRKAVTRAIESSASIPLLSPLVSDPVVSGTARDLTDAPDAKSSSASLEDGPALQLKSPMVPANYEPWRAKQYLQNLVEQAYPDIFRPLPGEDVNRVTVLLSADGRIRHKMLERIRRADLKPLRAEDTEQLASTIAERLGVAASTLGTMGVFHANPMSVGAERASFVVVYAWPRRSGETGPRLITGVSEMLDGANEAPRDHFDETTALALVERHLPDAFSEHGDTSVQAIIVLSPSGKFLRAGLVRIAGEKDASGLVTDSRLLGIQTSQATRRTIRNSGGISSEVLFAWQEPAKQ